jgi:uncharacterized protein (TIGR02145 family)
MKKNNGTNINEELLYEYVLDEMDHGTPNKGILTKAFLESNDDDEKAKSLYLKYRVEAIKKEIEVLQINTHKLSKEKLFKIIDDDFKGYRSSFSLRYFAIITFILIVLIFVSIMIILLPQKTIEQALGNINQTAQKIVSKASDPKAILDSKGNIYYEVESPYTKNIWLDRNLGASKVCESYDDDQCFGDYFQWGRSADGHEKKTSEITTKISSESVLGHDDFIVGYSENRYDWIATQDNTLWRGLHASNNPCPSGFRIPTSGEYKSELIDNGGNNKYKSYKSFLKLPMAGYRNYSGEINNQGFEGRFWTSTTKSQFALSFNATSNGKPYLFFFERANGYAVRCIKQKPEDKK